MRAPPVRCSEMPQVVDWHLLQARSTCWGPAGATQEECRGQTGTLITRRRAPARGATTFDWSGRQKSPDGRGREPYVVQPPELSKGQPCASAASLSRLCSWCLYSRARPLWRSACCIWTGEPPGPAYPRFSMPTSESSSRVPAEPGTSCGSSSASWPWTSTRPWPSPASATKERTPCPRARALLQPRRRRLNREPGHERNMRGTDYTLGGVGLYYSISAEELYVTHNLCFAE